MKLEWLAAVLRPHDIAAHPNFPVPEYDRQPHVILATAILGRSTARWPSTTAKIETEPSHKDSETLGAELALKTFADSTLRAATTDLFGLLVEEDLDLGVRCALTLVAASALAELEERESVEKILALGLDATAANADLSHKLVRICLLQQLSLRRRDWGSKDTRLSSEANSLLAEVRPEAVPAFSVGKGSTTDSGDTIRRICEALQYAIWSTIPNTFTPSELGNEDAIDWRSIVQHGRSEEILIIHRTEAEQYERFVESQFRRLYSDRSIRFGNTSSDLFYVNLRNELYGSGAVYESRQNLAVLRLVEAELSETGTNYADCLRLLRYGRHSDHLMLALDRVRLGGPLAALSADARQVIARRLTPGHVRSSDLSVLRAAADLLSEPEAARALSAVLGLIDAGSPTNDPGRWSAHFARLERSWLTVASLANAAGETDETVRKLLSDVRQASTDLNGENYDQSVDLAYAKAFQSIEVGDDWRESEGGADWAAWIEDADLWTYTRDVARQKLGVQFVAEGQTVSNVTGAGEVIGDALSGHRVPPEQLNAAADIVVAEIIDLQLANQKGRFPGGGLDPAQLAVDLIRLGITRVWAPFLAFLLDPRVSRKYKTRAIDRVLTSGIELPAEHTDTVVEGLDSLLTARDAMPVEADSIRPYPAGVRLAGSWQLVQEPELMGMLTSLAGMNSTRARIEAAKCLSMLAARADYLWLTPLALQSSYQQNAEMQGYAANALALLSNPVSAGSEPCVLRLIDLIHSDGMIAPLLAIRGLANGSLRVDPRLVSAVEHVSGAHPSRRVRDEAGELISRLRGPANS
ncbi:hypothetical protein [Mycobacterium sp. 852013-51886_SCH5428379]|uniref:hypothetical protein n=1 Tax=Mycobacterium sp. 852013-51886_SCH5428379 TaxID=1834111 RepID=UPI000B1A4D3E|nr:hypothetical protein [Mycobacterium sp. 852013-51886_SCH5428379]